MKHILVIGGGSIGKRHAKNLHELGCDVSVVDPRRDRRDELDIYVDKHMDLTMCDGRYDGVVIATPPAMHLEQCLWAAMAGLPMLCEKGITLDLEEAIQIERVIEEYKVPFLMGYTWRWWPNLNALFDTHIRLIEPLRRVEMRMCANLEDWHPWEPLREFYIATRGGIFNENHWIDIMLQRWGMPRSVWVWMDKLSDLDIDEDDYMHVFANYVEFNVDITLELIARPHDRSIMLVGENGTLKWTPNKTLYSRDKEGQWTPEGAKWEKVSETHDDRNFMFAKMMEHFIDVIDGAKPACTVKDGRKVLELLQEGREYVERPIHHCCYSG